MPATGHIDCPRNPAEPPAIHAWLLGNWARIAEDFIVRVGLRVQKIVNRHELNDLSIP
jgi:hypothetical protein